MKRGTILYVVMALCWITVGLNCGDEPQPPQTETTDTERNQPNQETQSKDGGVLADGASEETTNQPPDTRGGESTTSPDQKTQAPDETAREQKPIDRGAPDNTTPTDNSSPTDSSVLKEEAPSTPATKFADQATSWSVPSSDTSNGFFTTNRAYQREHWNLVDIDGDQRPDLVQTIDPKTGKIYGGSRGYWKVFKNTGAGFASSPVQWQVPDSGTTNGFFTVVRAYQREQWALLDIDGDQKPDLVQTVDPTTGKLYGGSRGYWKVFKNTGAGFSSTANQWSVPDSGTTNGFFYMARSYQREHWTLVDIDSDQKPDLVQTVDPTTGKIYGGSRGYWKVFKNTGSQFDSNANQWAVPSSGTTNGFFTTSRAYQREHWTLMDIDGDRKPDLVQSTDPTTGKIYGGSRGYWKVFRNTGSQFDSNASQWSVPSSDTSNGFYTPSRAYQRDHWSLFDTNGDRKPELVQTVDPKTGKLYGGSRGYWKVFKNTGSQFESNAQQWSVPHSGTTNGFFTPSRSYQVDQWSMLDMDGDRMPDLVQTTDPTTRKIFGGSRGYWKVFKATP